MKLSPRWFVGTLCLLAAIGTAAQDQDIAQEKALPPDVRLVIDVSGSMKRNDPNNLRQPAVELLVQLLPEDSRAGVWTFGKWINMLVPHKPVTTQWRESAQLKSGAINSVGLYTNIGDALEKAAYDHKSASSKYRPSIILLTDGMVDIDKSPEVNKKEWRRIVDEVLPKLKQAGFTIHTIALSDNADKNLMNKLSIGTGGMAEVAKTADDLMRIFLKAFDAAVPSEQVPLANNQFVIDSSVEEFTALIFRKNPQQQTELVGPDKAVYSSLKPSSDLKWHRADRYDLITVQRPLEGEWGIKADMAPDSRVTVVSNLNLRVKPLPVNVFKGQEEILTLFLQEDGKTIVREEFLSLMDIDASMEAGNDEFDLKEFWQHAVSEGAPPTDGRYTEALPSFDKDGIYQLNIVVDGKTFVRQYSHQFHVRQTFGAEVKQVFTDGKMEYVLIASSYKQNIDIPKTQLAATVITPKGRKKIRPLTSTDVDTWKATLLPDTEGEYTARVKAKGVDLEGKEFDLTLDEISFIYSAEGGFVEEKEPFFEPTAEPTLEATTVPSKEPNIDPVPEAQDEQSEKPQASTAVPSWMLYAILGVGNLLLLGLGYFAFRKILGKGEEDVLANFSDEKIAEETVEDAAAPEAEAEPDPEPEMEEEPPMEDLDPVVDEPIEEASAEEDDLDPEPPAGEMLVEEDGLDDLDQMASSEEGENNAGEEEDDMVAEMLKAQGLDLAEDELDEAISTLIDDLEDDEDPEEENK
ncbi:TIGR03503 family protein [Alteromonadaceae bacterium Bs31]|nr:TIGR03503 family protein [Alteromonadaceae bacterium Bs31]